MNKTILAALTCDHFYGGAEINLSHVLSAMKKGNNKVIVVIWRQDDRVTNNWQAKYDFEYHVIEEKGIIGLFEFALKLKALNRLNVIDFTYISNITLASITGFLRRMNYFKTGFYLVRDPSSPFIRYNSKVKTLLYKAKYLLGYYSVDHLIFQTSLIKSAFFSNVKIPIKSSVIGNPIDLDQVRSSAVDYMPKIDCKYIVGCGRLIPEKGFQFLIEAFAQSNFVVSHKLLILGDGVLKNKLIDIVGKLGLNDSVIFMGFVENPLPYFKYADCCVVSSISEGFPNVLFQMLALNDKVIMTRCCGDLDCIPGIELIDHSDISQLVQSLHKLISKGYSIDRHMVDMYLDSKSISNYTNKIIKILYKNE